MCALIGRTDLDNNNDTNIKVNEKCVVYTRVGRALPYPKWKETKKCHNFYIKAREQNCSNSVPGKHCEFHFTVQGKQPRILIW
jgi:hypothetical protein